MAATPSSSGPTGRADGRTRASPDADEGWLYEGLRIGSSRAFRRLLALHDAPMRRVVALYPGADPDPVVRRTWGTALHGLDMFTWHTTFRAWLFGILVSTGRRAAGQGGRYGPPADRPPRAAGPASARPPWDTLAWSSVWDDSGWAALDAALAGCPPGQRELVWLCDAEGWPEQEACDAVGVTAEEGRAALDRTRAVLADAVAEHLGRPCDPATAADRRRAVAGLLVAGLEDPGRTPEGLLLGDFRSWRRERGLWWWTRLADRVRKGRSASIGRLEGRGDP